MGNDAKDKANFFTECGEANRFTIHEIIGKGSYGVVCSATDNKTGEKVAIKKITDVFEHVSDATRILREVKLLRVLKHPDIVEVKHIVLPPNPREFKDIFVIFELMETDLHQVIKANDDLTQEHHQFFLYQLLRGLKYVHTANVYHRDLKPKNILANADCKLKICDFGLARPAFHDSGPTTVFWTDYIGTFSGFPKSRHTVYKPLFECTTRDVCSIASTAVTLTSTRGSYKCITSALFAHTVHP